MLHALLRRAWRQQPHQPPGAALPTHSGSAPEDVLYDAAARFLDAQISTDDVLDGEAGQAFSVGSVVVSLTFGLLALVDAKPPEQAKFFLGAALVAYIGLVLCSWRVSALRGIEYRPHMPTLQMHSQIYDGETLRRWVASEYVASIETNRPMLERKARWSGFAVTLLYAEGVLVSIAALITLL